MSEYRPAQCACSQLQTHERAPVEFSIGTTYDTPYESLERIPTLLKTIVKNQEKVRFERAHFQGYGNSALTFEVV